MGNWKLEDWTDYWKLFEQLCSSLKTNGKDEMVGKLKDAQQHVNGLSDGWYEFLNNFQSAISSNHSKLNQEERELSDFLVSTLKKALSRQ
ncbi:hypothetical protein HRG84_23785 [Flavisolibacter sp. BT320]|nr:hypothetical protein [Flavisolibacter longurius]